MRIGIISLLLLCSAGVANSQNVQSIQSNLQNISVELDKIMYVAKTLPPNQQAAIASSVQLIRQSIGENDVLPNNGGTNQYWRVLTEFEFNNFIGKIKQNLLFSDRLSIIKRNSRNTMFYMSQIRDLLVLFNFNDERDQVRNLILPKAIDPENVSLLYEIYRFESERRELDAILDRAYTPLGAPKK